MWSHGSCNEDSICGVVTSLPNEPKHHFVQSFWLGLRKLCSKLWTFGWTRSQQKAELRLEQTIILFLKPTLYKALCFIVTTLSVIFRSTKTSSWNGHQEGFSSLKLSSCSKFSSFYLYFLGGLGGSNTVFFFNKNSRNDKENLIQDSKPRLSQIRFTFFN